MTPPGPTILAFDTSAAHCAAALLSGGRIVGIRFEEMGRGQAERLMPLLEALLAEAGVGWRGLDAVAVGIGPGNFTGVRVAVAAARGLALGLGRPAVGVSTFQALMALAGDPPGRVAACVPAPRESALCQVHEDGAAAGAPFLLDGMSDGGPAAAADLVLGETEALAARVAARLGGPVPPPCRAVRLGPDLAAAIARLGAARLARGGPVPRPAPLYVRAADAAPPADPPPTILP